MEEENRDLVERPEPTAHDVAHAILIGAVGTLPATGGVAAELLSLILESPLSRRKDEWIESIAVGLVELRDKVEGFNLEKLAENESFVTTVSQASQIALRNHQQEKLDALRNAVLNSTLPTAPDETLQAMFLSWIDDLTAWHLRILRLFVEPRLLSGWTSDQPPHPMIPQAFDQFVRAQFPELDGQEDLFIQLWHDLGTRGLAGTVAPAEFPPQSPPAWMASNLGLAFLGFIESPV